MQKRTFLLFLVILFTITVKGQNTAKDILINTSLTIGNYVVKVITAQPVGTYKLFIK